MDFKNSCVYINFNMSALTNEQRLFIMLNYHETKSPKIVKSRFMKKFNDKSPSVMTTYKNYKNEWRNTHFTI